MPKLIKDAKENILQRAKLLLLQNGLSGLNMHALATDAGVAAGTLYNYFPSKEQLIVSVVTKDWNEKIQEAKAVLSSVTDAISGLEIIFDAIAVFSNDYRGIFERIRAAENYNSNRFKYHGIVIEQIGSLIRPLGERFGFLFDPTVPAFLAEVLISGATFPGGEFRFLKPCLKKIVCAD